jgi:hypothetical protein
MTPWDAFRRSLAVTVAVLALGPCIAQAQESPSIDETIARMAADPRTPDAYSASVRLHVKLRVFPFIGLTLNGNTTYRRPGLYRFVFRGVPKVAEKFDDLRYDLGDPLSWSQRYDLAFAPQSAPAAPVLRLTPKKPGLVAYLDVTTAAQSGRLLRAVWSRHDGGTITLVQQFQPLGNAEIVTHQVATINIPHMRAELTADYSSFNFAPGIVAGAPDP